MAPRRQWCTLSAIPRNLHSPVVLNYVKGTGCSWCVLWDANPLCMKTGSAEEVDESYMINGSEGVTCKTCDSSWHIEAHKDYVASHLRKDRDPTEY